MKGVYITAVLVNVFMATFFVAMGQGTWAGVALVSGALCVIGAMNE